ncbi:hypothetical protein [Geobacter sp. SVR]|uniref:hypothetical protein n=1 Tax=Geobacter sp. SVR TaxID=2495594 RepID=UPI00143F01B9|nr:hypothetical protein [Geobacter sp. SVR]BCS53315.1 hypothetical protein GSVR_16230 [Geobacter sp. SVR]GCF85559.1 hypothetical protein GSbR_21590 [Geobacter sp. SVR]
MAHPANETIIGRHIGTFHVSRKLIEQFGPELATFFGEQQIIPVRAECLFHCDAVEYTAYGVNFEPVPMGRMPYHYVLDVVTEDVADLDDPFKHHTTIKSMSFRRFN